MAYEEKVTRVIDGDTFETAKRTVRLANVDAAEGGIRGAKATNALEKLIASKIVKIKEVATDTYGRSVAEVTVGGKSVNEFMRKNV